MSKKAVQSALTLAVGLGLAISTPMAWSYDLMQAYQDALLNDAQLNSARASLEATRQQVPQAKAGTLPSISANAGINRVWTDTSISQSAQYTSQSYGIGLTYPLFRLQNVEVYEQSKLQLSVSEAQFGDAQQDLILRVAETYFDVLAAADDLQTVKSQKEAIAEQLAAAKRNFEVGTATVTDQQEAQARYDLTVAQELSSQNNLAVQQSALVLLTGKPIASLASLRSGITLTNPEPAVESVWTERARDSSFAVIQARMGVELSRREVDRQRYARYPTVDVVGNLSHNRNPSSSLNGINSNNASLGLQLGIPLYSGGAITASVREAAARLDKSNADLEIARRAAEQSSRQSYLGLVSGLGQVRALEAAEKSSRLALDSNRLGYQVGVRINVDVLNAQQQLFSTQRDLARARYDVLVNGLRLKSTAGGLVEGDLRAITALLSTSPPAARGTLNTDTPGTTANTTNPAAGNWTASTSTRSSAPGSTPVPALPQPIRLPETKTR